MFSIMMRLATSTLRLHVIAIRAASSAAGAVFTETRALVLDRALTSPLVVSRLLDGYRQRSTPSFYGNTSQPPLDYNASVTRTL